MKKMVSLILALMMALSMLSFATAEQGEKGRFKGAAAKHDAVDAALIQNLDIMLGTGRDQESRPFGESMNFLFKIENTAALHDKLDLPEVMTVQKRPGISWMTEDKYVPLDGKHDILLDPLGRAG